MVLKESITYYLQHQSSVFCTFLDATKAFDRLNYCKVFKLLVERDIPAHIIRVLVNLYTNNLARVSWDGVTSERFLAANGAKQGAVLSPVLFYVYRQHAEVARQGRGRLFHRTYFRWSSCLCRRHRSLSSDRYSYADASCNLRRVRS